MINKKVTVIKIKLNNCKPKIKFNNSSIKKLGNKLKKFSSNI